MNGRQDDARPDHVAGAGGQIPSLDEALQYSPFTSILPFSSEVISPPEALPSSQSSSLLSTKEQVAVRDLVDTLNYEPANIQGPSSLAGQVLGDLRHILDPQDLSRYDFALPPNVRQIPKHPGHAEFSSNGQFQNDDRFSRLSPFAQRALKVADIGYSTSAPPLSHATASNISNEERRETQPPSNSRPPHPPKHKLEAGRPSTLPNLTSEVVQHPTVVIPAPIAPHPTHEVIGQTSYVQSQSLAVPGRSDLGVPPQTNQVIVMVPDFPPSSDPSQYQNRRELDAAILNAHERNTKKRKRDDQDTGASLVPDQREEADAALQSFQAMLMDIFEAENQADPESFDTNPPDVHKYFILGRDSSGSSLSLGPAVLTTLENTMSKLIGLRRFEYLTTEQLSHLQKLSSASLGPAAEIDLSSPKDDDVESLDQWVLRVGSAENSLRASRLLLKIMTARGKAEKQLSSEELVRKIVNNLKHILDSAIIPLVEKRKSSEDGQFFEKRPDYRSLMVSLMQRAGRVLRLAGDLVLKGDLSETSVTTIEFLATKIVFTENAPSDKESILGIQKFEVLRRHAMDVVAKVFFRHPEQRDFLFGEILSSLEKLPVTRQSARQYKISEGKPIQLVSALIMQLIQTSTIRELPSSSSTNTHTVSESIDDSASESEDSASSRATPEPRSNLTAPNGTHSIADGPIARLEQSSKASSKSAESNASSVCRYLVQRAINTTKTGDLPYRNLLDIFTEDFLNVLGSPEWPAAELLLRALLVHFLRIAGDDKSTAPAKNMALELMGTIGSGIADMRAYVSRTTETASAGAEYAINDIPQMSEELLFGRSSPPSFLRKEGPYRAIIDHLQTDDADSLQSRSARYFVMTQWARNVCEMAAKDLESDDTEDELRENLTDVARWLTGAIQGRDSNMGERRFDHMRTTEARLYNALILLNMPLCRAYDRVFNVLLRALTSQQATVRSRGIKSVAQLLEKDDTILDRAQHVMAHIVHATSDTSPLVRDSALSLVGKCMAIKPALESDASKALIAMSMDAAPGVRKRALKLLRDLYLRNRHKDLRAAIADAILRRLDDIEESIVDLARQSFEDIWFTPFHALSAKGENLSAQARHDLEGLASLIVATAARGEGIATELEILFKQALGESAKNASANQGVCKSVVALLFENIIDNEQEEGKPSRKSSLQTLTIFAKAEPRLFDAEQMITLRPYIDNISFSSDDNLVYRSIIMIYRRVLPVLPPLQKGFLLGIQEVLLSNITKLGKHELNEATSCLWIINDVLQNTERLARLTISVLVKIESAKKGNLSEQKEILKMKRLMMLAGYFGKACDFQSQRGLFKEKFPSWKGTSISELIVEVLVPLAGQDSPQAIRESALESLCLVCQAWPKSFLKSEVSATFRSVFESRETRLVQAVLSGFRSFYSLEDERSKTLSETDSDQPGINGGNKLDKSMTVSHNDGAATSIAQQFLKDILRIALSSRGDLALLATHIITSTNRQGLVHPKECGPALVALETSPDPSVAKAALEEHRSLHSKHESMLDKEYVKAVEEAFLYQRDTIGDPAGVDAGMNPKLRSFYEVLKTGSVALRKKLLANLCAKVNFDASKLSEKDLEFRLQFARFVLENLSLFEYGRVDELLHLISCIEKIFTGSGNAISQRIESTLNFQMQVQDPLQEMSLEQHVNPQITNGIFDRKELQILAIASMVHSMLWQTRSYLRRAWGLQSSRSGKIKAAIKDVNKIPVRVANVSAEEHMETISQIMSSGQSEEKMIERCRAFVELLTVDNELKVDAEEDGEGAVRYDTPSEDDAAAAGENGSMGPPSVGSKQSRKMTPSSISSTPRGTPSKRGRPSLGTPRRSSSKMSVGDDGEPGWD